MRRTLHVLSLTVLAGPALLSVAPVAAAEPAAEVSPATVEPGGTLTISVSCDPVGGHPPDTIDATSQAFDEGSVPLRKVTGNDDKVSGPAYRGTARIAPAGNLEDDPDAMGKDPAWTVDGTCPAAPGGEGKEWSATFRVAHGGGGHSPSHKPSHGPTHKPCHADGPDYGPAAGPEGTWADEPADELGGESAGESADLLGGEAAGQSADVLGGEAAGESADVLGGEAAGDLAGESGDVPGGEAAGDLPGESGDVPGEQLAGESADVPGGEAAGDLAGESGDVPGEQLAGESADVPGGEAAGDLAGESSDVPGDDPAGESWQHETECGGAVVQRGVRAGDGGAFSDSVPALVAGGVLIAGAFGAAVHRLRNRESDPYR